MAGPRSDVLNAGFGVAALTWPALVNGWPLVFHDTGGYLERGYELTLGFGRSLFYGLFLRAMGPWPAILLQAALGYWMIGLILRIHRPAFNPALAAVLLAAATGLPFFTSQLMPDFIAGPMVLALYLLIWRRDDLGRFERAALVLVVVAACLFHMSNLALAAPIVALGWRGRWLLPALAVFGAVGLIPLGDGLIAGRFTFTPGGAVFLLGRLVQDGRAREVLDEICPDERFRLCPWRETLPDNANDFLWGGEEAALRQIGGLEAADPEARALILESLRRHPLGNLTDAMAASFAQFFRIRTADGLDARMWHTEWRVPHDLPGEADAFARALQQREPKPNLAALDAVHSLIAWICVAGLAALAFVRRDNFSIAILLALVINAMVCGVLSNPQGRYQDRLIWLAPLTVAALL